MEKGCPVWMRMTIDGRKTFFEWSYDGSLWKRIGAENLVITKKSRAAMIVDNRTLTAHWKSLIEKYPV